MVIHIVTKESSIYVGLISVNPTQKSQIYRFGSDISEENLKNFRKNFNPYTILLFYKQIKNEVYIINALLN